MPAQHIETGLHHPTPAAPIKESERTTLLHTTGYLVLFSILGTLSRLGLTALTSYSHSPLAGVIWANFAGCTVMGFLVAIAAATTTAAAAAAAPSTIPAPSRSPLYVGLATGYCGSFTSFSAFQLEVFHSLLLAPRGGGAAFMAVATYLLSTLALSFCGLQLGTHLAAGAGAVRLPRLSGRPHPVAVDWAVLVAAAAAWAAALALALRWRRGDGPLACVFAPPGAVLRFWASRWGNPRVPQFPVGTWACNVGGCALAAGAAVAAARAGATAGCDVWCALVDGFCGCLTTVSTWVVEMRAARSIADAYVYGAASVGAGLALVVAIEGSWVWSGGAAQKC